MKRDDLPEIIDEFGRLAQSEFSLEELLCHVRSRGGEASEEDVYDIALTSDYLFEVDSLNEIFVPRRAFFQGAQFNITPTKEEVQGGYLVPGHRLMPFVSREVFPADARIVLPDGSALLTRKVALPQAQVMPCLHFYGVADAIEYLLLDTESNLEQIRPPFDGDVEVTVFDLRDYFAASGFHPGDSLMLTVIDWLQGVCSVARVAKGGASLKSTATRKWIKSMQFALDDAIDVLGTEGDCYEQLALAMRNAQYDPECISLTKAPPVSLAEYFNSQKEIAVKMVGERGLFWEVEEDPQEEAMLDALTHPSEPKSELDAFFQELGLSVSEDEAEAYMRDALYHGADNPNKVLGRVVAGRSLRFATAEDQESFHSLWNDLWNDVLQTYSKKSDPYGEVRSRFLVLNDKCLAAMRQLDARGTGIEIMDNPAFIEFSKLTGMIGSSLAVFNQPETFRERRSNPFEGMMEPLDSAIDDLIGRLQQSAPKSSTQKSSVEAGRIYQLKVSLKGAKPPIWRRILIPSNMELIDLHDAIQAAMGWQDCHLHQFKQGRKSFQSDPDADFPGIGAFETQSSDGVRIGDLLRKEKEKIAYEYDFGDSWEHEILLEKMAEPEEGQAYPLCIKGMRACPPEDCGGLWGYYNLLEILEDPECDEHDEMMDWAGGPIDPEAFDLDEANARIRQLFA